ncbi:hypothetical protein niasHT_039503 [Heterodera trifolii]|uniref:Glutaredoxin domain-containing protein n=1 Tax=Heterodera trifolii TaxID=157864 RepID=A0ABD2IWA3_9BILA
MTRSGNYNSIKLIRGSSDRARHGCHFWHWQFFRHYLSAPPVLSIFAHLFFLRHFFYSNNYCLFVFRMQLIILISTTAERSAAVDGFYWPTTKTTAAENSNNFFWANNYNNNNNDFNVGAQQQQQQFGAVQQPANGGGGGGKENGHKMTRHGQRGRGNGVVCCLLANPVITESIIHFYGDFLNYGNSSFNTLSSLLFASAGLGTVSAASAVVAPGAPIGIVPLSRGVGGGIDLSPIFGNFDRNGRSNFNFGGATGAEETTDDTGEQFTPFPTLIPADKVRQLVMATEPNLVTAFPSAGDGAVEGEEEEQLQQPEIDNSFMGADRGPVPLGEVRDLSMMRSIPVFGYARRGGAMAAGGTQGTFGGTFSNGAPTGFGTLPINGAAKFGGNSNNNNNNNNCFFGTVGGECANAWNQFGGGANKGGGGNDGAPGDGEAMPSPSMVGGAGSFYVGDGDGAYEYPLVDDTDAFGGAPGLRHQQGHTFAGYMRGSFEMDGGQMPSPSYPNFGGFGRGGAYGGAGREESPEEWEDEMVGGGGEGKTEMGQIERGGGMPFWMGGTMAAGETTDGTRTDSEEQQRYSQYLETIHQRYGVVPSAAGRSSNAQQQHTGDSAKFSSFPSQLAARGGGGDGILPSIGFGGTAMPYELRRFGGIFSGTGANRLAPRPKESPPPSPSPFSASFGTFPSASLPCAAAADPPSSPSFGLISAVGATMADCAEMAATGRKTQFGLAQNIRQLGGGEGTQAAGAEVGAGQGRVGVGVPWKVNGAVVVPMENDQNNNNKVADGGDQNARNGGQYQQLQKMLSLQQRKTVPQMPNFNGAVSGYDGGPFSVGGGTSAAAADGGPPWRQHQKQTPPPMVAQQNAVVYQQGNAGHWQMPTTNGPEIGWRGGEAAAANSDGRVDNNNLQQQLLEQSLLLALLTTQQQTTTATPINRMPTQPMPMMTPEAMEMPMMATTTMEMPIMTTPTTATTHGEMPEEKTPPIQKSTTSLQALSQQIRRLPAVLYADSRKSDSRQLEVLLRDGYGLPLVTFYADKIGRLAAVEANLAKLTAHREMPFLFICGTFIGSLEHIKKYHEQKQMPRLVEFVCSGEAEKSGDGAETAPVAGKALEKQNKGEEMGRKRRRESNSRKRKKKKKKRKEEEEKEEKEENWK